MLAAARRLAAERDKTRSRLYLTFRMTVVPEKVADMPAFVRLGNKEGYVNRLAFGFDKKTMPKWVRKHPEPFRRIYEEFLSEASRSKVLCDSWRLYQLARDQGLEDRRFAFGPKGQLLGV